jgi:phage gpG-like protein
LIEITVKPEGSEKWMPAQWQKFYKQFQQNIKDIPTTMAKNINRGMMLIAQRAQTKYLTGGTPLFVQTGRLRASVHYQTKQEGPIITSKVGTDVFYGKIHENGGVFQVQRSARGAYTRRVFKKYTTKAGKNVKKKIGENLISGGTVKPYTLTFKRRPWLEPAVVDEREPMRLRLEKMGFNIFQLNKKEKEA